MSRSARSVIEIEAPVETVYGYWETFENLPDFMAHVKEVRRVQPNRTVWRIGGSWGKTLDCEVKTVLNEPYRRIKWVTTEGDTGISGEVRFEEAGPGRTRTEVELVYAAPPDERAKEKLSRSNPYQANLQLDRDLETLKTRLESTTTLKEDRNESLAMVLQSPVLGFAAVTGVLLATIAVLILISRKRRHGRRRKAARSLKFDKSFWKLVLKAIVTSR